MPDVRSMVRFARPGGGHLEFGPQAIESLMAMRQLEEDQPEAGGVLLGRLIVNTEDVVVDEVTTPSLADTRSRYFFRRSRHSAQPRVNEAWKETVGTRIYLGDWHSHPEDHPTPWCVDRRDWNRVLKRAVYEQDFLFFVIVGRKSIGLWEGRRTGKSSTSLQLCQLVGGR